MQDFQIVVCVFFYRCTMGKEFTWLKGKKIFFFFFLKDEISLVEIGLWFFFWVWDFQVWNLVQAVVRLQDRLKTVMPYHIEVSRVALVAFNLKHTKHNPC